MDLETLNKNPKVVVGVVFLVAVLVGIAVSTSSHQGAPPGQSIYLRGGRLNKFCAVDGNKNVQCNQDVPSDRSTFFVEPQPDGRYAFKNKHTNQYCQDNGDRLTCNRGQPLEQEKFHWRDQPEPNTFAMTGPKSGSKRLYCSDEGNRIACNRQSVGGWEKFTYQAAATPAAATSTATSAATSTGTSTGTSTAAGSLVEGASVRCNDGSGKIYRYMSGTLRHYPSVEVANTWNPQWSQNIVNISAEECSRIPKGPTLTNNVVTKATTPLLNPPSTTIGTLVDPNDSELACYLDHYPDLKAAFGNDVGKARLHWMFHGWSEGRVPHCPRTTIDTDGEARCYLARYPELQQVFGSNLQDAKKHYLDIGFKEGRSAACPLTDAEAGRYLISYADLRARIKTVAAAKQHWIQAGWREGRRVPNVPPVPQGKTVMISGIANNKICTVNDNKLVACNRGIMEGNAQAFLVEKVGDDEVALKSVKTGQYCSDNGSQRVVCDRPVVGPWEKFKFLWMSGNGPLMALRGGKDGKFCTDENSGMICNKTNTGLLELYKWKPFKESITTCNEGFELAAKDGSLGCVQKCNANQTDRGVACQEKCREGYKDVAGVCWKGCGSDIDVGALCRRRCPSGWRDVAGVCWKGAKSQVMKTYTKESYVPTLSLKSTDVSVTKDKETATPTSTTTASAPTTTTTTFQPTPTVQPVMANTITTAGPTTESTTTQVYYDPESGQARQVPAQTVSPAVIVDTTSPPTVGPLPTPVAPPVAPVAPAAPSSSTTQPAYYYDPETGQPRQVQDVRNMITPSPTVTPMPANVITTGPIPAPPVVDKSDNVSTDRSVVIMESSAPTEEETPNSINPVVVVGGIAALGAVAYYWKPITSAFTTASTSAQ